LRSFKFQLLVSLALSISCAIFAVKIATATEEFDAVKSEASKRLSNLKSVEDRLQADIDQYNHHIEECEKAIAARRSALQQVRNEIRSIQIAFKWF